MRYKANKLGNIEERLLNLTSKKPWIFQKCALHGMILVKECIQDLRQECNVQIQKELTDKIWEQKEVLKTQQQINEAQENILVGVNRSHKMTMERSESRPEEVKKEEVKQEEVKVIEEEMKAQESE